MMIEDQIKMFLKYLHFDKKASQHTIKYYRADIQAFIDFARKKDVDEVLFSNVTSLAVRAYISWLYKTGYAKTTIIRRLISLRVFFNYLLAKGMIASNPLLEIKTPKVVLKHGLAFAVDEVANIFSRIGESTLGLRDRALLELLYATGMKVSELVALCCSSVDLNNRYVIVNSNKVNERIIPIGAAACEAIKKYLNNARTLLYERNKSTEHDYLFINHNGGRLSDRSVRRILEKYIDEGAKTKKINPMILRRTFAQHLLKNGADVQSVRQLLGLSDLTNLEGYIDIVKDRISSVYKKSHPRA